MNDCVHHWLLASPDGGLIRGTCKHCGAERLFPPSLDPIWNNRTPPHMLRKGLHSP